MIIQRTKYFADKKDKSEKLKGAALIGGGAILAGSKDSIGDRIIANGQKHYQDLITEGKEIKDNKKIYDKLTKLAKDSGTKIEVNPYEITGSRYEGSSNARGVRKAMAFLKKKTKNLKNSQKIHDRLDRSTLGQYAKAVSGKDKVVLDYMGDESATLLSHELGHSQYLQPKRSKSILGKAAHRLHEISQVASNSKLGTIGSAINGVHSGLKEERNKSEGKKTSAWTKAKASVIPAALAAPMLIAEGKASLNGLKNMKKLGASKELLKNSKKTLGSTWSTYAGLGMKNVITGEGSRWVGKGLGKVLYNKDKKKKDDNTKD